jgi:hypothetical protein
MAVPIPIIESSLNLIVNVIWIYPELSHIFEIVIIHISLHCGYVLHSGTRHEHIIVSIPLRSFLDHSSDWYRLSSSCSCNSTHYYLCAESTATRPITDTAQCRYWQLLVH